MTDRRNNFVVLVEIRYQGTEVITLTEVKHCSMSSSEIDGIIVLYVHICNLFGILKKIHELPVSIMLVSAHFSQVVMRQALWVKRDIPTRRACDVHGESCLLDY